MVAWLRVGAIAGLLALLGACAQLPSDAKVKAFGDATSKVSSIYKDSVAMNAEMAQRLGDETGANKFINGDEIGVQAAKASAPGRATDSTFNFPPRNYATISGEALKSHGQLIAAVGNYGKALGEAADKGTITELEAAATTLGAAVGVALTPIAGSAAIPIISPAAKWMGRGLGLAVTSAYAVEIQQVMNETHPVLLAAAVELKNTLRIIKRNNDEKLDDLKTDMNKTLQSIRIDPKVPRNVLNAEYRASAAEYRALSAKHDALTGYSQILDALVKAHKALLEGGPDSDKALTAFLDLTKQLGDLASAAKQKV